MVDNEVAAFHLDRAVMRFGQALETALEESVQPRPKQKALTESQKNSRRQQVLENFLQIKVERKYRDPFADASKG